MSTQMTERGLSSGCEMVRVSPLNPNYIEKDLREGAQPQDTFEELEKHLFSMGRKDLFPRTELRQRGNGRYYIKQERIFTEPGQGNLGFPELTRQTDFDKDQITNPKDADQLLEISRLAKVFYWKTLAHGIKEQHATDGERLGWLLELAPDSFVKGYKKGDSTPRIYFVDFFPILQTGVDHMSTRFENTDRAFEDIHRGLGRITLAPNPEQNIHEALNAGANRNPYLALAS